MNIFFLRKSSSFKSIRNKNENGNMTIEASIVLTGLIFFVLLIMDVGMIYRAQNYMTHSIY